MVQSCLPLLADSCCTAVSLPHFLPFALSGLLADGGMLLRWCLRQQGAAPQWLTGPDAKH